MVIAAMEIKRRLLLGRKVMINLDSIFKSRDITLSKKVRLVNYVIDVEDDFTNAPTSEGSTEQMLIHVKLLVANIIYIGVNGDRYIEISRKVSK